MTMSPTPMADIDQQLAVFLGKLYSRMRNAMSTAVISSQAPAEVPVRGMPLGLRLAIFTLVIVTIVMGSMTAYQEVRNSQYERQEMVISAQQSLVPLAARIEADSTIQDITRDMLLFHQAIIRNGIDSHQLTLRDAAGQQVMVAGTRVTPTHEVAVASVPLTSPLLNGTGTLTVFQDDANRRAHVQQRWIRGALHFIVTLGSILIALQLAIRRLVTAPLARLLEGIRKTEMGYWGEVAAPGGAWEIRWVIWRFQNMGRELEGTVQRLLAAEQRARRTPGAGPAPVLVHTRQDWPAEALHNDQRSQPAMDARTAQLEAACARLETGSDPVLAREALDHLAFEAEAMDNMTLKSRLENAGRKALEPAAYHDIEHRLESYSQQWDGDLSVGQQRLRKVFHDNMVPVVDLQSRSKHIAGIMAKMKTKGLEFKQVHDLFALRVVVPSESDCYWALGLVHETFRPVIGRFKDYIAAPKPNGYRSIHTSVHMADDLIVEIQIRSAAMHCRAESGSAAHLIYKKIGVSPTSAAPSARARKKRRLWDLLKRMNPQSPHTS